MVTAAFTGSFDPAHDGHRYVVDQAQVLGFDVIVVVANNTAKTYESSLASRLERAIEFFGVKCIASDADNIGNVIKELGCKVIVRGLRDEKDFRYEQVITDYNRRVNGLETFYIPTPPSLQNISSSSIKGLAACSINRTNSVGPR